MTTAPETSLNGLDLLRAVAPLVSETQASHACWAWTSS